MSSPAAQKAKVILANEKEKIAKKEKALAKKGKLGVQVGKYYVPPTQEQLLLESAEGAAANKIVKDMEEKKRINQAYDMQNKLMLYYCDPDLITHLQKGGVRQVHQVLKRDVAAGDRPHIKTGSCSAFVQRVFAGRKGNESEISFIPTAQKYAALIVDDPIIFPIQRWAALS